MAGRTRTHPDTTPQHPTRLSDKAIDLLRRIPTGLIWADNEPEPIVKALLVRGLVRPDYAEIGLIVTDAGRALLENLGKAK